MAATTGAPAGTTTTRTRSRLSPAHLAGWPVLALALISWIILLAGVAALQKSCSNDDNFVAVGSVLPAVGCNRAYKYQWWKTFLQLFVILAVAAGLAAGWLRMHRAILLTLLAIITVLLMDDVNTFVTLNDIDGLNYKRRVSTYLAGTILSCFSNFLLIFALGSDHDQYMGGRSVGPTTHSGTGLPGSTHTPNAPMPMRDSAKGPLPTTGPTTAPAAAPIGETVV